MGKAKKKTDIHFMGQKTKEIRQAARHLETLQKKSKTLIDFFPKFTFSSYFFFVELICSTKFFCLFLLFANFLCISSSTLYLFSIKTKRFRCITIYEVEGQGNYFLRGEVITGLRLFHEGERKKIIEDFHTLTGSVLPLAFTLQLRYISCKLQTL